MNKIEELLKKDGIITYRITGISMYPLLRQGKDLITVTSDLSNLKKYDVILYKRSYDDKLTLHRLIAIKEDYYVILGDNCVTLEKEKKERVIGKLVEVVRDNKTVNLNSIFYKLYVLSRMFLFPFRVLKSKLYSILRKWIKRS